jgi:lipoprotein-releasing system ATP-binding protein
VLSVKHVAKSYATPRGELPILRDVSLELTRGDAIAIMGPSGSGKSTLLYILGALDAPSSGTVTLDGENPFALGEREQARFRNNRIGFVFQDHSLLPQCSVLENVLTPTLVADANGDVTARARDLLTQVGLSDRLDHRPGELSGGEKQRAALARALIRDPLLLRFDEPTGNLDRAAAVTVASLLLDLHPRRNTILVVVTHRASTRCSPAPPLVPPATRSSLRAQPRPARRSTSMPSGPDPGSSVRSRRCRRTPRTDT